MKLRRSGLLLCSLSLFGMLSSHSHPSILNQRRHGAMIVNPNYPSLTKTFEFRWEDKDGNTYPLVGAKVEWSYKQLDFTYTTYTDEFGYITINFLNQALKSHFTLNKLSLENDNISIKHFDNNIIDKPSSVYTMDISSFNNSSTIVINPNGSNSYSEDFGKATHIFESLYYYSQYTRSILPNGETLEHCDAYYPCQSKINADTHELDDILNAYYSNNGIYLPAENFNNNLGVYESWDTIGHEYGHHLGETLNILPAFYSGSHDSNLDDIDQYILNKTAGYDRLSDEDLYFYTEKGLGLAWSEAWPTYWANQAQKTFPSNLIKTYALRDLPYRDIESETDPQTGALVPVEPCYSSLANDRYEAFNLSSSDYYSITTQYTDNSIFTHLSDAINAKIYGYGGPSICGEACERSIMGFLYSLNSHISHYSFEADHIWKLMFSMRNAYGNYNGAYTTVNFSTFYNYLNNNYYSILDSLNLFEANLTKRTIAQHLEYAGISAQNINAKLNNEIVSISWTLNGNYQYLTEDCLATFNIAYDDITEYTSLPVTRTFASEKYAVFSISIPVQILNQVFAYYNTITATKTISLSVCPHAYSNNSPITNSGPYTTYLYDAMHLTVDNMIKSFNEKIHY